MVWADYIRYYIAFCDRRRILVQPFWNKCSSPRIGKYFAPTDVQVIQARLSGVATEINVSLGSKVKSGDVLFKIQDKDVIANFDDNELTILTATASIMQLKSESKGLLEINFPEDLVAKIPNIVAQEQNVFCQRMRQLERELDVLDQEMEGLTNSNREKNA